MTVRNGDQMYDMPRAKGVPPRWTATVYYRTADGDPLDVQHTFEELDMLHDLIERGPDFHAIVRIVIEHSESRIIAAV